MDQRKRLGLRIDLAISVVLLVSIGIAYSPLLGAEFINFDDPEYVLDNPHVLGGISSANFWWAVSADRASNWHPLTWWSHQIDVELWGKTAAGHHATAILLHSLSAILVYLLFRQTTDRWEPSLIIAGLFALHPINVESVAWISERKNVLSTFFGMACLLAYSRYSKTHSIRWYLGVTLLFVASLGSKPMLVTLPFVLLLVDYWPLARFSLHAAVGRSGQKFSQLVLEKIPWFVFSGLVCAKTMLVQQQAQAAAGALPLYSRFGNAALSYARYIELLIWPHDLAISYPHPLGGVSIPLAMVAVVGLFLITMVTLRFGQMWSVGWLWYLGTLVPVLGLVQVGKQAMADRYAYWPAIGLFLIGAYVSEAIARRFGRRIWGLLMGTWLVALGTVTYHQAKYWQSSVTLMEHSLCAHPENAVAAYLAGLARWERGDHEIARRHFEHAVRISPTDLQAGLAYAKFLLDSGQETEALREYSRLEGIFGPQGEILLWRGVALARTGSMEEAAKALQLARPIEALSADADYNLGLIEIRQQNWKTARRYLEQALDANPIHRDALIALAGVAEQTHDLSVAPILHGALSTSFDPNVALALASLYLTQKELSQARSILEISVQTDPRRQRTWYLLGVVLMQQGEERAAVRAFRTAVGLAPSFTEALNDLAWVLATTPDAELRSPHEALALSQRAESLAPGNPGILDTLAAAYAACGDFTRAEAVTRRAIAIAKEQRQENMAANLEARRRLYLEGSPYRRDMATETKMP